MRCLRRKNEHRTDRMSMTKNNIEINIYGGNVQVLPDVKEVEQNIYTKDGKTTIINKFKV